MTTKLASLVAFALLAISPVEAAIDFMYSPGATLYVRVKTGATSSVAAALTEGTSGAQGFYSVADSALVSAGLTNRGKYSFKILVGAPSTTADDLLVGIGGIDWTGTMEIAAADKVVANEGGYNNVLHVGSGQKYSTIDLAKAAAVAGDLVVIHPGTYTDQVGKTNVTYFAAPGVTLDGSGGVDLPIFDGTAAPFVFLGKATLTPSAQLDRNSVISVTSGITTIECQSVRKGLNTPVFPLFSASNLAVLRVHISDWLYLFHLRRPRLAPVRREPSTSPIPARCWKIKRRSPQQQKKELSS